MINIFLERQFFLFLLIISSCLGVFSYAFADDNAHVSVTKELQISWKGMDHFYALLEQEGFQVRRASRLDLNKIKKNDGILVIYPTHELEFTIFESFLKQGGRVAILDDFGRSGNFISLFGLKRTLRPQGSPFIEKVIPNDEHPITKGIEYLLTNNTSELSHPSLEPILRFETVSGKQPHQGFSFIGAVGSGRLITMSDSSIFINQMLSIDGNRKLALNLADYLTNHLSGSHHLNTLWVLTEDFSAFSSANLTGKKRSFLEVMKIWKRSISTQFFSGDVLRWIAFTTVFFLFLVLVALLPKTSPYDRKKMSVQTPSMLKNRTHPSTRTKQRKP